jgi:hypothetical protein
MSMRLAERFQYYAALCRENALRLPPLAAPLLALAETWESDAEAVERAAASIASSLALLARIDAQLKGSAVAEQDRGAAHEPVDDMVAVSAEPKPALRDDPAEEVPALSAHRGDTEAAFDRLKALLDVVDPARQTDEVAVV